MTSWPMVTGIEYVVAIASPTPFRDLPWYLTDARRAPRRVRG